MSRKMVIGRLEMTLYSAHKSREASRNWDDSMPWRGPAPVSWKQNEEAFLWRAVPRPVCTSQASLTLSLLPFRTFSNKCNRGRLYFLYISVFHWIKRVCVWQRYEIWEHLLGMMHLLAILEHHYVIRIWFSLNCSY